MPSETPDVGFPPAEKADGNVLRQMFDSLRCRAVLCCSAVCGLCLTEVYEFCVLE